MKVINQYMSASESVKNGTGELYLYGDIVDEKWWDEDVSPKSVRDALSDLDGAKNLDIHINSYGGSCIAGNAIISILDSYRKKNSATLNVYIEGIAASMGSGIASVGDKVYMADNALYMIHKPLSFAWGNADELQKTIEVLDKTEDTLVRNYMRKFNGTEDELRQIMADETWFTAEEAKDVGLVDEIVEGVAVAASAKGIKFGGQDFGKKTADLIKNKIPNIKQEEEEDTLEYDEKLKDFGISEESFKSFNIASDVLLNVASMVKDATATEPVEQFVDKAAALEKLGCEDITADQLIDFAKAGMHPADTADMESKAKSYDKILAGAKASALDSALKAQGDSYSESRMKKYLDVLSYDEIIEQDAAWKEEAAKALNAGRQVSHMSNYGEAKEVEKTEGDAAQYKIFK